MTGPGRQRDWRAETMASCDTISDLIARLEELTTEPHTPHGGPARPARPVMTPEPYGQAGRALMDIHEGVRRLEASLRLVVLGHPGRRRGGSAGNTAAAIAMIAKLATRATDAEVRDAGRNLSRWIGTAQSVDGIDEARRWRHLPKHPGEALPPQCPYCRRYFLLADVDAQIVVCSYPGCADRNGEPPVASYGVDSSGQPVLTWADGLTQTAPDLEEAS